MPPTRNNAATGGAPAQLTGALEKLDYTEFMQRRGTVSLAQLRSAAAEAAPNPDRYLAQVVLDRSRKLREWAADCPQEMDTAAGAVAH